MTSLAIHVELAKKSIAVAELRHDRFGHRELGPLRLYPFLGAVCRFDQAASPFRRRWGGWRDVLSVKRS